jgi:hypothetical protein
MKSQKLQEIIADNFKRSKLSMIGGGTTWGPGKVIATDFYGRIVKKDKNGKVIGYASGDRQDTDTLCLEVLFGDTWYDF